jgi:nucleoside phosphorylase
VADGRIAELVDKAFDYRGYVTLRRNDGSEVVGYVYDRGPSHVELFDESATRRLRVPLADIADIAFTGEDSARKSQEIWERRQGRLEARDTPADGGWGQSTPILVLAALERELRSAARVLGKTLSGGSVRGRINGVAVVAHATGMGEGARHLLERDPPRLVLSCGFAGGLDPSLAPGDVVLATEVLEADGGRVAPPERVLRVAAAALGNLRFVRGGIVSTKAVAAAVEEKRALARSGASAVDMESYAVGRAAEEARLPWLSLRAIVDPLESPLPAFAQHGEPESVWPALRYALSGPRAAARVVQLARNARRAGAALEEALRRIVPALASAEAPR